MELHETLSKEVGQLLSENAMVLATAESCTGGGVATSITAIAGSSEWFDRAFITYSNEAKMQMLGVRQDTLDRFGAVSEETVKEMARGAIENSNASVAVSISGIAGPGGGSDDKPVGTVWFSWASKSGWAKSEKACFSGDRTQIREQAVYVALKTIHDWLNE